MTMYSAMLDVFNQVERYYGCLVEFADCDACLMEFDPFISGLGLVGFFAAYSFIWSIIGNNCSKVDQIWSITPVIFVWHFFRYYYLTNNGAVHHRLLVIALLVTAWGVRLTFNFWRKGGYGNLITHEEDYRWPIIRSKVPPVVFLLFNFSFIAIYQNVLLFLIALPAYEVMKGPSQINIMDITVAFLFTILLLMESVADEQHFNFQARKYELSPAQRAVSAEKDIRNGFYTSGLFQYCRHPNYFAEQMMWVCVYLFSLTHNPTGASSINWTITGVLQLILLFQGSMNFSESISVGKYPLYKVYQETTSMCVPLIRFVSSVPAADREE